MKNKTSVSIKTIWKLLQFVLVAGGFYTSANDCLIHSSLM